MRGWTKALMWIAILLGCAVVGAGIAYLFPPDPFPPGVRETGGSVTPSPQGTDDVAWTVLLRSRTTHRYRVGGICTSDWRMRARIRVSAGGRVRGDGVAILRPGAGCDFPSAQVQAESAGLSIVGVRDDGALLLRFRTGELEPAGSQDLGGFLRLLPRLRISIEETAGATTERPSMLEQPDDEIYAAVTSVSLRS